MPVTKIRDLQQQFYNSGLLTITSGGLLTLAHGLHIKPLSIQTWLRNITAEQGYAVGDYVWVGPQIAQGSNKGIAIIADSVNLKCRFGSASKAFSFLNFSTGNVVEITNANWKLEITAHA